MDLHGNYQYFVQCYHFDNSPQKGESPSAAYPSPLFISSRNSPMV